MKFKLSLPAGCLTTCEPVTVMMRSFPVCSNRKYHENNLLTLDYSRLVRVALHETVIGVRNQSLVRLWLDTPTSGETSRGITPFRVMAVVADGYHSIGSSSASTWISIAVSGRRCEAF